MITDENDSLFQASAAQLQWKMEKLCNGKVIDRALIHEARMLIYYHRTAARQRGIDFPHMVLLFVPRLGVIEVVRADLDIGSIRRKVVNFVRFNPAVTPQEVADAVTSAWGIKPGELVDEGEHVRSHDAVRAEQRRLVA